jgi:NAD(P)-dependent dehydrogenase (short-subunit alcohol dehydrogenase family)
MELKNAKVFVTGAGSGIGRETAIAFARAGSQVFACDRDLSGLAKLENDLESEGKPICTGQLDVTDRAAFSVLADSLAARQWVPDVVVNNAGIGYIGTLFETPPEMWERIWQVNVMGVVNGCQIFGPQMVAAGGQRFLVNVASTASATPLPNMSAYAASKFAVEGLNTVLAMELEGSDLQVIGIHPGIINTPIVHDRKAVAASISDRQLGKLQHFYKTRGCAPSVVAEAILAAVMAGGKDKVFVGPLAKLGTLIRRFASPRLARTLTLGNARAIGFVN